MRRILPVSDQLRPAERLVLAIGFVLLLSMVASIGANAAVGLGGSAGTEIVRIWVSPASYILVGLIVGARAVRIRGERAAWILIGAGLLVYGLGNVVWTVWLEPLNPPPIPSIADVMWLSLYPACYVGIVLLARRSGERRSAGVWLDGIVAGLGLAAVGAAFALHPVMESLSGGIPVALTEMAYPVGDLLLAALVVGVLGLRAGRIDRLWALLAVGFVGLAVADCLYATQVAGGALSPSSLTNLAYGAAVGVLALAAWQPTANERRNASTGSVLLVLPAFFTVGALGLLVYDHFSRLDPVGLSLAVITLLVASARVGLTFRDVRALAETRRLFLTDDLTSMPNRRALRLRIDEAIAAADDNATAVAMLIIDLDHFKELNDTLGHDAGDVLLLQVGERLSDVLGSADFVARLGGDEFGVLLSGGGDAENARRVARELTRTMSRPFPVGDVALRVTASIGIAIYPEHADGGDRLMQCADIAMYEAKAAQSFYACYDRRRDTHSVEQLALAGDLSRALQGPEIEVYYQPKAEANSRLIVGVEALVRWRHPDRGMMQPAQFVPVAEQAGLGRALTQKVLAVSLGQLRRWQEQGVRLHLAVNTTVADLQDAEFPATVSALLSEHQISPESLTLEITETMVLADPVRVGDVLAQLGELGVSLSLDDFGTGYSSLTHLKMLPVGEVKIDRFFIARMTTDLIDAAIVHATIRLAHDIGIRVVAEGIEDEETWAALVACGCELIQGYALSRPLPADELLSLLLSQREWQPKADHHTARPAEYERRVANVEH